MAKKPVTPATPVAAPAAPKGFSVGTAERLMAKAAGSAKTVYEMQMVRLLASSVIQLMDAKLDEAENPPPDLFGVGNDWRED